MEKKILILTGSHDLTCDYLLEKYGRSLFFRLNTDYFSEYEITFSQLGFEIRRGTEVITTDTCASILYRKPIPQNLGSVLESKYHDFAHIESFSLIDGIIESFDGLCLSKPSIMRRANNKIVQLALAKKIGLQIPNSRITNSSIGLCPSLDQQMIVKPLAIGTVTDGKRKEFVQTNVFDPTIDLSLLRYAPAYFQRYVEKDFELRITMIGEACHTIRIDSKNKIDWRKPDNEIAYSRYEINKDVESQCRSFMRHLGMQFGCFDFIVRDSEYYFLEMNANGQWAWLDKVVDGGISDDLISFLAKS